jgi:hypothetical protein
VFVVEFWRGAERQCGHRCQTFRGPCKLDHSTTGMTLFVWFHDA